MRLSWSKIPPLKRQSCGQGGLRSWASRPRRCGARGGGGGSAWGSSPPPPEALRCRLCAGPRKERSVRVAKTTGTSGRRPWTESAPWPDPICGPAADASFESRRSARRFRPSNPRALPCRSGAVAARDKPSRPSPARRRFRPRPERPAHRVSRHRPSGVGPIRDSGCAARARRAAARGQPRPDAPYPSHSRQVILSESAYPSQPSRVPQSELICPGPSIRVSQSESVNPSQGQGQGGRERASDASRNVRDHGP